MEFNEMRLFSVFLLAALLAGYPANGAVPRSSEVVTESSDVIEISASRGVLIRLARPASTVFVANPKVADIQMKSPRLVYVLGKEPGETTFFAVDAKEQVLANRRILVSHNLSRLRESLESMLPQAKLDVRSVDSSIVIGGRVRTIIEAAEVKRIAERFVDKPDMIVMKVAVTAPTQVQLRVRVAEVSRDVLKQFGLNWCLAPKFCAIPD